MIKLIITNKVTLKKTSTKQWCTFSRLWWLYDLKWQCPFKSAKVIVRHLEGKHKPIYHPLSDIGDHVVVINTQHMAMEGELWRTFKLFHHTGYPGGFSATRAYKVHNEDPTKLIRKIIYSNIKGTLLRRPMMEKLYLYKDENIPDEILKNITGQIPQIMQVPKKLKDFSEEERRSFPKLFDWLTLFSLFLIILFKY
ncbi:hypothetical protein HELRODRAFT_65856 [Helobdella robusta]|uniref:39S ribosomal protein L13, mitochondrial n=1 Tax=Helobdella robusta TaxID=6412 RepID=T1FYD8_HELRO|nr:hypothetical protein HELRODRAFT_65856 [Helobdella robusta]ESO02511.1 hypothetical protein HELRODRAFT_65856 [Helobdella robusta]